MVSLGIVMASWPVTGLRRDHVVQASIDAAVYKKMGKRREGQARLGMGWQVRRRRDGSEWKVKNVPKS